MTSKIFIAFMLLLAFGGIALAQGDTSRILHGDVQFNDGTTQTTAASGGGGSSIGGTVTGGTTCSVLFIGAGPVLAQDNSAFCWDVTNHRLGIGTTTPAEQLQITKNFRLPDTTSTVGAIKMGSAVWAHAYGTESTYLGRAAGNFTGSGINNVCIGDNACNNFTTGTRATVIGDHPTIGADVDEIIAVGEHVVVSAGAVGAVSLGAGTTAGGSSVAIGVAANAATQSVAVGSTSHANGEGVAVGINARADFSTSTALGGGAGQNETSSANSTMIGWHAFNSTNGGGFNTGVGTAAGQNVTTGNNEALVGYDAGGAVTTGSHNSGVGSFIGAGVTSGIGITTGSDNTLLGYGADVNSATASFRTAIGSGAVATADHQIMLGTASENVVALGRIGVGTTTPAVALDVVGATDLRSLVSVGNTAQIAASAPFTPTSLSAPATNLDTTLTVGDTTGYAASGVLFVDYDEYVTYTGKTGTTFTGCTRGAFGSTASNHSGGSNVIGHILTTAGSPTNSPFVTMGNGDVAWGDITSVWGIPDIYISESFGEKMSINASGQDQALVLNLPPGNTSGVALNVIANEPANAQPVVNVSGSGTGPGIQVNNATGPVARFLSGGTGFDLSSIVGGAKVTGTAQGATSGPETGTAYGLSLVQTLKAETDGDRMVGLSVSPTYDDNGHSGTFHADLELREATAAKMSVGTTAATANGASMLIVSGATTQDSTTTPGNGGDLSLAAGMPTDDVSGFGGTSGSINFQTWAVPGGGSPVLTTRMKVDATAGKISMSLPLVSTNGSIDLSPGASASVKLGGVGKIFGTNASQDYFDPFNGQWATPGGGHQFVDSTGSASWTGPTAAGAAGTVLSNDGAGNTSWTSGLSVTPGQLPGTITNDNATAGNVGEEIIASVLRSAPTAVADNTTINLASVPLTAGDWEVFGAVGMTPDSGVTVITNTFGISKTTATIPATDTLMVENSGEISGYLPASNNTTTHEQNAALPPVRVSLPSTQTIYLVVRAHLGGGTATATAYGSIRARRAR